MPDYSPILILLVARKNPFVSQRLFVGKESQTGISERDEDCKLMS